MFQQFCNKAIVGCYLFIPMALSVEYNEFEQNSLFTWISAFTISVSKLNAGISYLTNKRSCHFGNENALPNRHIECVQFSHFQNI